MNEYNPDYMSPLGSSLLDCIQEKYGPSTKEEDIDWLARQIDFNVVLLTKMIDGDLIFNSSLFKNISETLCIPESFLISREDKYRQYKIMLLINKISYTSWDKKSTDKVYSYVESMPNYLRTVSIEKEFPDRIRSICANLFFSKYTYADNFIEKNFPVPEWSWTLDDYLRIILEQKNQHVMEAIIIGLSNAGRFDIIGKYFLYKEPNVNKKISEIIKQNDINLAYIHNMINLNMYDHVGLDALKQFIIWDDCRYEWCRNE